MSETETTQQPTLLEPMLAPLLACARPVAIGVAPLLVATAAFIWFSGHQAPAVQHIPPSTPQTFADLSERMVTPVDSTNRAAVAAAVAALKLPVAQRGEIENEVLSGRRRIGWLVLTDSIDPDGDTVAIESEGMVQHVVLSKAWVPVAVLSPEAPIGITAVRDGGGGGVTIALATRNGSQEMRIMLPGEHIVVVP